MSQTKGVLNSFSLYWNTYGGLSSLITSPYLAFSVICSILMVFFQPDSVTETWSSIAVGVTPNLLGFAIGVYAMLMALANADFWKLLAAKREDEPNNKYSPYMEINGTFVHFVVVQIFTLLFAVVFKYTNIQCWFLEIFGLTLFIYSIFTALAAAFAVLKVAKWFELYISINQTKQNDQNTDDTDDTID